MHNIMLATIYVILLLCFGGFYETSIILAGVFVASALLSKKITVRISFAQGIFFVFALWYFLCSLQNGFFIEYASRGLIPLVVFLFWIYITNAQHSKQKIIDIITESSVWIAAVAIFHCVGKCIDSHSLQRLTLPFDYSNVCGIYFAVCYFWAGSSSVRFVNKCKYVFLTAIILSQSVGAIGLFALAGAYQLIKEKKYGIIALGTIVIMILAVVLKERITQSIGTFLERLLQIYDAFICIGDNPVMGIGAGWWEFAKQSYQTGFYEARVLHSSVVAIGVNSGIAGLALFGAVVFLELKKIAEKKHYFVPTAIILLHSLLDFSLSFLVIPIALLLSLADSETEKTYTPKPLLKKLCAPAITLCFIFLLFGSFESATFQKSIANKAESSEACDRFNSSFYLRASVKSAQSIGAHLYLEKNNDANPSFKKYKYLPTEMILQNSIQKGDGEKYLLKCLKEQPYNTALKGYIVAYCSEKAAIEALQTVGEAGRKSSFLGKALCKFKGENV